jgi:flagellar motor switch protein FliM
MPDILSQDEIDALLSATEGDQDGGQKQKMEALKKKVAAVLADKGLSRQKTTAVWKKIQATLTAKGENKKKATAVLGLVEEALAGKGVPPKEISKVLRKVMNAVLPPKPIPPQRIVTSYDFKHPARVNKDQLRTLENLHDNFARLLSSTFSGAMRAVVDVDTAFVDQTTYAEFIMSLSNPSCSYQFTLGPTNGQAIIDVAMPVVFSFVDRNCGGKGSSQGVDARQLTPIEIGIINRIIKQVIEDLEATWEPILEVEISDIELETNPEFMQITAASEIVILLAFEVNSTNASGLVSLCYPFFTLESILPRLGQQSYVRQHRTDKEELERQNWLRLGKTWVPVSAELGRAQLSLKEVRNLKAGDVLCSDTRHGEPLVLSVGDEPKYLARPFAGEDGRQKLKVAQVIPPELEEVYKNR